MPTQLSLAEARRRGPRIAVLPDAARVEERLGDLARQRDFVPFRIAFSVAELGRELIREAQRAGSCPEVASRFAVQLALRQAARDHSPGPYFAVRNHAGYARALGDLLAALSEGLLEPEELAALDVGGRALALGRTLAEARDALGRVGLADPHRALRLAVEHVERGGALPRELADAAALEFDCVLDWTPLRLRLAKALATRLRVRIRLPWSGGRSDLTDPLEPTLRAIEKLVEPAPELELFDPAEQAPALAPFLRRLFAADGAPADAPVELVCCASPGAQAREVARRCAALIRSGAAADSIAVAARSLANGAAEELGAAFDRVGVPWRERRGRPALPIPTVRLALSLLELLGRWGLWRRLRVPEPVDAGPALDHAAVSALGRDQAAARALEQACAGLAAAAVRIGEARMGRREFAQLLSQTLAEASLPPGGARGGAVQLMELRELPGRSFDHLLLTGLVDGELPARPLPDPLLSDEERRAINRAAKRMVFRAASGSGEPGLLPPRQAEETLLFHLALCAARRSATLVWPRSDAQGRDALRSPFADEAARALGKEPSVVPLQPIPLARDCADASDLLARAALDAFAEPAYRVTPPADPGAARALVAALAASRHGPRLRRIARAAGAERERVRAFIGEIAPGRFSGQLSGVALQRALPAFAFGPDSPLSAHQLQDHATCAFRTLGKRLLRIEVDDRDDAELGPRERGTVLHRCLERFFRRMRDERRLPLRGVPEEIAVLREVASAEMDAFATEEHVGHRALWELKRAELLEGLVAVVEAAPEARPVELERRFGFEDPDSWPPLRLGEVHVRGIVDRIDRLPDGTLLVIDYKSSRIDSLNPRLKPEGLLAPEFQLPLYAAMLRQREPSARVDAAYFSLKDARRTKTLRENGVDLETLPLAGAVQDRVERMRAGRFPVRPLSCDYCQLKPLCRLVALPTDPDENGGEVPRA